MDLLIVALLDNLVIWKELDNNLDNKELGFGSGLDSVWKWE